jgi:pimeloyl-ACP methyl ester carboxylesterase
MTLTVKQEGGFKFVEEGEGEVLLLLHGLFGALSNWEGMINHFKEKYKVIIPMLPIYEMPIKSAGLDGLVNFLEKFVAYKHLQEFHLIGNSLGGHVGLIYTLKNSKFVRTITLTGSSGLFENGMGGSFPKRGNYEYVSERVKYTFFDPNTANKELIDEVYQICNDIPKCMRIIAIAKSAQRHNMAKEIPKIDKPTLLIWGLNDTITPPLVAHEFNRLMKNSVLRFVDQCGHAPMMEHPELFNQYYEQFIQQYTPVHVS